jgi:hypothetical protein
LTLSENRKKLKKCGWLSGGWLLATGGWLFVAEKRLAIGYWRLAVRG